ncbi:dehydrogenase [Shewanella sediminis HAW-EB3]|uniref:Dehydrogenase n=1 Tax=Shewanella sediminis (strain HAW-EB3) TaxID=425104 RepID=A8FR07_SHESH|nr:dehydrogenase [Shewanella sediminis]ABV35280.1 dehydrogenase [Shewanella sediminis HAW-EB3]
MYAHARDNLPVGKVGTAIDIAKGNLFVIDNSFMTGAIIDINGGVLVAGFLPPPRT